jgi:dynein light chain LC8-type
VCVVQDAETVEHKAASVISAHFNKKYDPTWQCIVGRNFGSFVTSETKTFSYFYLGQIAVLLFKAG